MVNLLLSLLVLVAGPVLVGLLQNRRQALVTMDAFVLVVVGGLVLTHILPEGLRFAGAWAGLAAVLGFAIPSLAERVLHHGHRGIRGIAAFLAVTGILLHSAMDGLGLRGHFDIVQDALVFHELDAGPQTLAILLHRIPVAMAIWWIVPRTLGWRWAWTLMGVIATGTILGFYAPHEQVTEGSMVAAGIFQAALGGSLLHVLMHAHIPAPKGEGREPRFQWPSVLGAGLAILTVVAILSTDTHDHTTPAGSATPGEVFLGLTLESAPALLLAFVAVGLANAFLPANWTDRLRRGTPMTQAFQGVMVGLPLPVCSCGVVPLYRELVLKGAAVPAAVAFLIATPELEIAAVLLTWDLMGGEVALARVLMAAGLAVIIAWLVSRAIQGTPGANESSVAEPPIAKGTHPDETGPAADAGPTEETGPTEDAEKSCCASTDAESDGTPAPRRWRAVIAGFGDAVDNTGAWILLGLAISAFLVPYVDPSALASLGDGWDVPLAALLGLPIYVCASGSTPLAAVLIAEGLSPGAGLAFLITGPATNATTFGLLKNLHGGRVAVLFSVSMFVGATAAGLLANQLLPTDAGVGAMANLHQHQGSTLQWAALVVLIGALALSLLRTGVRRFGQQILGIPGGDHIHDHGHHHDHDHDHPHDHPGGSCH